MSGEFTWAVNSSWLDTKSDSAKIIFDWGSFAFSCDSRFGAIFFTSNSKKEWKVVKLLLFFLLNRHIYHDHIFHHVRLSYIEVSHSVCISEELISAAVHVSWIVRGVNFSLLNVGTCHCSRMRFRFMMIWFMYEWFPKGAKRTKIKIHC